MSTTVTVLIVYLGILAALAIWSRRETHTLSGFYLAGKKLSFWVVAFSTNATGESGWLLLGLSGMMSEAELHSLKVRMQDGARNKAARGELRVALPVAL